MYCLDADLMTLYPEISGQISEEVIGQCAGDYWKGRKNRRMRKCIKKMEAEDQQLIWEMLDNIAAFRCFQQEFNNACTNANGTGVNTPTNNNTRRCN